MSESNKQLGEIIIYQTEDGLSKIEVSLQNETGLCQNGDKFLIGMVTRLTGQKGLDLVECVLDAIVERDDIQLVVLGTGEPQYENMLRHFSWKYGGNLSAMIMFDNKMSHRIYAGCDAFLMPSLFEPCGLSQMMACRYGTIPVVRETGGLKDSIPDCGDGDTSMYSSIVKSM